MSSTLPVGGRDTSQRLLGLFALMIGGLGLVKYITFLRDGFASSPWGFLLVFVLPFLIGWLLLRSHPRVGAAVIGTFAAALATVIAVAAFQGAITTEPPDSLIIFIGGPLALAAVALSVRVIRSG